VFVTQTKIVGTMDTTDCKFSGFWRKLNLSGSEMPTSRDNATLFHQNIDGADHLTLIGGNVPRFGCYEHELYTANLNQKKWMKIQIENNKGL
jgi:hypothetical protein